MLTKTPFLPGFSTLLCGRAKRKDQDIVSAKFKEMTGSSLGELSQLFSAEIPASLLQSLSETKRDRLYSSYEIVSGVVGKGVAYIGRNYHARKVDFRRGRRIGKNQRLVTWKKPHWQPPGSCLSKKQWDALPEELEIRLIRTQGPDREGRRRTLYIVTTLLDNVEYPAEEIVSLYAHRWEIELRYRDIKTTMGMEMLRTKTPEMIEKEILMYMIAYNLVRLLMLQAGKLYGINHRRISFKATIQILEEARVNFVDVADKPRIRAREKETLLDEIANKIVKERPGRNEPRKKKLRPKSYGWVQKPRHQYFEHFTNENPPSKILDQCA